MTLKVGQICWTSAEFDYGLGCRLVKVVSVDKKRIKIKLLNPTACDKIWLEGDDWFYISSVNSLFTSPSDWTPKMEGTPESITNYVEPKTKFTCASCNSKVTAKMKFCSECGEKL